MASRRVDTAMVAAPYLIRERRVRCMMGHACDLICCVERGERGRGEGVIEERNLAGDVNSRVPSALRGVVASVSLFCLPGSPWMLRVGGSSSEAPSPTTGDVAVERRGEEAARGELPAEDGESDVCR